MCSPKFARNVSKTTHLGNRTGESPRLRRDTMKAIIRDEYGSPDVLELRDIDKPEIGDDEVLLHVHAAGVGRDVWHVMAGLPYPIRPPGYGLPAPQKPLLSLGMGGGVG